MTDLTVPMWALVLGVAALFSRRRGVRVLAGAGWALLAASVVAGVRGPDVVWAVLTGGLVRYPGRLVFAAVVALVPAAAASVGERRLPLWSAAAVALLALGGGVLSGGSIVGTAVQGLAAGAAWHGHGRGSWGRLLGSAALMPAHARVLVLRPAGGQDSRRRASRRSGKARPGSMRSSPPGTNWGG